MSYETVFDCIKKQEVNYQKPVTLIDGWDWSMKDHLRRSFLYKNSQFEENNEDRELRPNKNIILAIRNVENRTEGFDVKDIELYVNDADEYYKSFLVRKYHDKWALENSMDTFIDDMVDSYGDYGGVLVRNTNENRPEVIDLQSLAFCNQTDILAYPFCIKHIFSQAQLRKMDKWGLDENGADVSIEDFIILCKDENGEEKDEIEVYELHGLLPKEWMSDERTAEESKKDLSQVQIVAYYKKQDGQEQGVTLFKKREPKLPFKFLARDKIVGRALGRGGVEELFEPQKWTNWNEITITEMLNSASKTLYKSTDPSFKNNNNLSGVNNNEVLTLQEGRDIGQIDTYPRNAVVFNEALIRWESHAQTLGSASQELLSGGTNAGTPFKLFEAQVMEDKSMHRFRQGQIAVFMDEVYRDWILPHIAQDIANDHNFLADLSADEMQGISKNVANKEWNKYVMDKIAPIGKDGEIPTEDKDAFIANAQQEFINGGLKRFVEIWKDDIKKPLDVFTNIAGKQKNLALLTDKLTNVLRQFLAAPQLRQDPEMVKLLNVILESSGMSPIMFGSAPMSQMPQQQMQQMQPQMANQNA